MGCLHRRFLALTFGVALLWPSGCFWRHGWEENITPIAITEFVVDPQHRCPGTDVSYSYSISGYDGDLEIRLNGNVVPMQVPTAGTVTAAVIDEFATHELELELHVPGTDVRETRTIFTFFTEQDIDRQATPANDAGPFTDHMMSSNWDPSLVVSRVSTTKTTHDCGQSDPQLRWNGDHGVGENVSMIPENGYLYEFSSPVQAAGAWIYALVNGCEPASPMGLMPLTYRVRCQ